MHSKKKKKRKKNALEDPHNTMTIFKRAAAPWKQLSLPSG